LEILVTVNLSGERIREGEGATATYTDKELEQAIIDNGRLDLQDATAEEGDTEEGDPSTAFQQTQSSEATPDNPYQ
jgi:hypothetical protein